MKTDKQTNIILATLIFLLKGEGGKTKVLLAEKVRKIGIKRLNGFGGKVNKGETPRECAVRELRKETSLIANKNDLEWKGVMTFHNKNDDGKVLIVRVFIFVLREWRGKLKPKKDEMIKPRWYKVHRLPFKRMMAADKDFVRKVLESSDGEIIRGEAWNGPDQKTLLKRTKVSWLGKTSDTN